MEVNCTFSRGVARDFNLKKHFILQLLFYLCFNGKIVEEGQNYRFNFFGSEYT